MIGYACSNITLQEKDGTTPARTCRISTLLKQDDPIGYCVELAKLNIADTLKILKWNKKHNIFMYRISASIFPFGTHPEYHWSLELIRPEIENLGKYIKKHKMRVSSHLPQYINIGSPNKDVVIKSIKDLEYQTEFFDRMGLGPEHKIIIHVGGVYNDREESEKRFINIYNTLPENVKSRLVIENDEKSWTIEQMKGINKATGATLLIDYLHWQINHEPENTWEDDLQYALSTWKERPKIHYSEQDPDKNTGAHSYIVKDIITSPNFDTMVEAKGKEMAILPFIKDNIK